MKDKKIGIYLGIGFFVFVFLIGGWFMFGGLQCAEGSEIGDADNASIRLAISNELLDAIVLIARDKGFFEDEGVDIQVTEYASGKLALQAMFAGEVDIAPVAAEPVVFNSFKWDDFSVVSTIGAADKHMTVVGRKDLGVESPGDLKGKRFATQKSSALHYFSSIFLAENDVSEDDVNRSYLHITKLNQALIDGDVDAVAVIEPFTSELREEIGDEGVFFTPSGIYVKTWSLSSSNEFIESNPETILKIIRALIRAEEFLKNNRTGSVEIIARDMEIEDVWVSDNLDRLGLQVSMGEWYEALLGDIAKWAIDNELTEVEGVPDYSNYLYKEAFIEVKAGED